MRNLDRRLLAVMFTDMVGYTALIQADEHLAVAKRDHYIRAVERGHQSFGGTIIQRLGDGTMSMFPSALAAARAAVSIQRELTARKIPARIGIHVGEVIVEPERLTGDAVNIASRIESFAVPGGVMLSDSARDQLKNRMDVTVVSLGRFQLKNVARPLELFAVSDTGIIVPDPQALEGKGGRYASLPRHLPDPGPPLVGRDVDFATLVELIHGARVVTVSGPGGVGKTRILTELGRRLASEFPDGVAFIALADVTDPAEFLTAIALALDVKEAEGRTLGQGVFALLSDKRALLLLDNLEQIVAAAPDVARLVERCPHIRIVTTSRTPLRIATEREYPLAPLALPASDKKPSAALIEYPAVALFVERAQAVKPGFTLTAGNASAVVSICRRLDGLPLALELAAARLRLLAPRDVLERLDHALSLLITGPRDGPTRHQTLRATIDWSHSLLTGAEQRLFRRMAVFNGGCALADVEAVCAVPGEPCLDELESLVDKALALVDGQSNRLRILQTIGEYARERLEAAGETEAITLRHAQRYAALTQDIRDGVEGADQVNALACGIAEEGNLQAALDTFLMRAQAGDMDATGLGMRMCGDLQLYWHIRGKNLTAREYATAFLAADTEKSPTLARSGALRTAGLAWWVLGDIGRANDLWAEAYHIAEELDDDHERGYVAVIASFGQIGIDPDAGLRLAAEGAERCRAIGFTWAHGLALAAAGILQTVSGDPDAARAAFAEGLAIQRRLGDQEGAGMSLGGLAALAAGRDDLAEALHLYEQSRAAFHMIADLAEEARIMDEMAWIYLRHGDVARARQSFLDSARAYNDVASVRGVGLALVGLAATESVEHQPERAVQIAAAAEVYAHQEGIVNVYSDDNPGREFIEQARAALSEEEIARATRAGRDLSIEQALALATVIDATLV